MAKTINGSGLSALASQIKSYINDKVNGKQDKLETGASIQIVDNVIDVKSIPVDKIEQEDYLIFDCGTSTKNI